MSDKWVPKPSRFWRALWPVLWWGMLWEVLGSQEQLFKGNLYIFSSSLLTKWLYRLSYTSWGVSILDVFVAEKKFETPIYQLLFWNLKFSWVDAEPQANTSLLSIFCLERTAWDRYKPQTPLSGCCISLQIVKSSTGTSLQWDSSIAILENFQNF